MIRPTASTPLFAAARASFRAQTPALRTYATEVPRPAAAAGGGSNLPLFLALGGLGGLGAWYSLGGFGDKAGSVSQKLPGVGKPAALKKDEFLEFTLKDVKSYNHDSATLTFELPEGHVSGLNVASAVLVAGAGEGLKDKDGKTVIRPYTPVSAPNQEGTIDFLIKEYKDGNMSKHLHALKRGDKIGLKGPIPKWQYKANEFETIALIAGGSGITPMWQLIQQISSDPSDKTKVTLLYTNKSVDDILLKEKFDALAKDERFNIIYGVDKAPKGFKGFTGYITPELLSKELPPPALAGKIKVFVCGPPGQVEAISGGKGPKGSQGELKGLLADLGYQPDQVYKF